MVTLPLAACLTYLNRQVAKKKSCYCSRLSAFFFAFFLDRWHNLNAGKKNQLVASMTHLCTVGFRQEKSWGLCTKKMHFFSYKKESGVKELHLQSATNFWPPALYIQDDRKIRLFSSTRNKSSSKKKNFCTPVFPLLRFFLCSQLRSELLHKHRKSCCSSNSSSNSSSSRKRTFWKRRESAMQCHFFLPM